MASSYLILPPATPSDLISHIISNYRYPSTLLIGTSKELFLRSLDQDIDYRALSALQQQQRQQDAAAEDAGEEANSEMYGRGDSELLRPTLLQIAVSRHIRAVFIPTVVHLRAYLSVFSQDSSAIPAPPIHRHRSGVEEPPALLVYGFLELHRATSEWSAQGLANSTSVLVEAAARNGFGAAIVDPIGGGGYDTLEGMMSDGVPMLSGTMAKSDGSWSGRSVEVQRVLGRWFRVPSPKE